MKYLVMECHRSYAVVLDEDGRFIKVANMHYEVGQKINEVIPMKDDIQETKITSFHKFMRPLAALAAAVMIFFASVWNENYNSYASIYMSINPEIKIDIRKNDTVSKINALNDDAKLLLDGYEYKNKSTNIVMEELVKRAIDMGFLSVGDAVTLKFDSKSKEWIATHKPEIIAKVDSYISSQFVGVTIEDTLDGHKIIISTNNKDDISPAIPYDDSDYNITDDDNNEDLQIQNNNNNSTTNTTNNNNTLNSSDYDDDDVNYSQSNVTSNETGTQNNSVSPAQPVLIPTNSNTSSDDDNSSNVSDTSNDSSNSNYNDNSDTSSNDSSNSNYSDDSSDNSDDD